METPPRPPGAPAPEVSRPSVGRRSTSTATDVAYIGGAGRSGSTVLALLLGEVPGFFPVGGVNNLWERGLQENYLCGCGVHFRDCGFWDEVGREGFGGWDSVEVDDVLRLKAEVTRYRHLPGLLAPGIAPRLSERVAEYLEYLSAVYRAIERVSGCGVVVDNSHDVPPAVLLRRLPDVRGHVVHLVRDSRGVAFSLSRVVPRAEATAERAYMPTYSPIVSSGIWLLSNVPYHVIRTRSLPRIRVRYETFVAFPAAEIARIVEFLGLTVSPSRLSKLQDESIELGENHMISGNPHRLGRASMRLRLDDEWRAEMRATDRMIVTLLTSPLALAYGYVGRRPGRATGRSSQTPGA